MCLLLIWWRTQSLRLALSAVSLGNGCIPYLLLSPCSLSFLQATCFYSLVLAMAPLGNRIARPFLLLLFWTLKLCILQCFQLTALAHTVFGTLLCFLSLMAHGLEYTHWQSAELKEQISLMVPVLLARRADLLGSPEDGFRGLVYCHFTKDFFG